MEINLISDTVTRPNDEMLAAMMQAKVGDDVFGEDPTINALEQKGALLFEKEAGLFCPSGTMTNQAAIRVHVKPGDEVITTAAAFPTTVNPIVQNNLIPVFLDVELGTYNIDVNKIEDAITDRTKAIMTVHIGGYISSNIYELIKICDENNLMLIEDAAQAHGSMLNNKKAGTFGIAAGFSFFPTKVMTTGEGGMIVTDDDIVAEKCRSLRNLCFQSEKRFFHEELGWNFRMTNIQAALGLAQIEDRKSVV